MAIDRRCRLYLYFGLRLAFTRDVIRSLAFLLLVLPTLAFARLGETEPQLTARFGAPISRSAEITTGQGKILEFGTKFTYRQDDWAIDCVIVDGRSVKESYRKSGEWTDVQVIAVINGNSQGAKWTEQTKESIRKLAREWRRSDGAEASWNMGLGITVTHPAYKKAKDLVEAKAKAAAGKMPKI